MATPCAQWPLHAPFARPRDHVQLTDAFLTAWQKEPGDTLADAVNAVSRAAHEHPLFSVDIRQELERQAGRLLYVEV